MVRGLDVLGAQTEGMIGYVLEQEMGNVLPFEVPFATLLTMIEVDPADPAFSNPTKFVGPVYDKEKADSLAAEKDWIFKADGEYWRRVVPSPEPKRIFEIRPIRWLLEKQAVVICAGGGGVPTMYDPNADRTLIGVEAVIDKDLASELLAREVDADFFVMVTDVDGVYVDWGTPDQNRLERVTPSDLRAHDFAAGSMGPKVEAACRFVEAGGRLHMQRPGVQPVDRDDRLADSKRGLVQTGRRQARVVMPVVEDRVEFLRAKQLVQQRRRTEHRFNLVANILASFCNRPCAQQQPALVVGTTRNA